ncbi:MAG: dUTP diphosphatase, partial [Bacteroidetes bacterium]|nr:dUTP diphosphatase [Bacteroidota bacterium]
MEIKFKKFNHEEECVIPSYATDGSAGMDLSSSSKQIITVRPGETKLIPTNLLIEIPSGYEGQVRPRSGLALKHGITVL